MTAKADLHAFTTWVRGRLDEMDAGIDAMESTMGGLEQQVKDKVAQILDELKKWRADFEAKAKEAESQGHAAWDASRAQMNTVWGEFEEGYQNWVQVAQKQGEAFEARTQAQLDLWQSMLKQSREQAEAAQAQHKDMLKTEIDRITKDAEEARGKLQEAGAAGWAAMTEALETSRKAFEQAAQDMQTAFTQATEQSGGSHTAGGAPPKE